MILIWDKLKKQETSNDEDLKHTKGIEKTPIVRSYKELESPKEFLKNARQVYAMGITVAILATSHDSKMIELINEKDVTFTILLPPKNSVHVKNAQTAGIITDKSFGDIQTHLERFQGIYNSLDESKKQNFHVRLFDLPLLHSMFFVNPNEDDGYVKVSLYGYDVSAGERPEIFLKKKDNPEFFGKLFKSYQFVRDNSTEWKFPS